MSALDQIKVPIKTEMDSFESKFKDSMASKAPLLDKITNYIVKRKGKQMRPMFVFLSAKLFGEINESSFRGASMIELLHTATLVHDDIVDDANMRRGFFSINALWKNKIAVLGLEGKRQADWVLIDANDVIVHLFRPEVREFYGLERMWADDAVEEIVTVRTDG